MIPSICLDSTFSTISRTPILPRWGKNVFSEGSYDKYNKLIGETDGIWSVGSSSWEGTLKNGTAGRRRYLKLLGDTLESDSPLRSIGNAAFFKLNDILQTSRFPNLVDGGASSVCNQIKKEVRSIPEPIFIFANIMEAHSPLHTNIHYDSDLYDTPRTWSSFEKTPWEINMKETFDEEDQEYIKNYREVYRASIDYLDRRVSRLIDQIQRWTDDETTIIVTADHGENLAYEDDDRMLGHSSSISEGLLHVPMLLFNTPGWMDAQYNEIFSHLDLGELIQNMVSGEEEVPFRNRVPAERIGSGGGNPKEVRDSETWDRMFRVVYDEKKYVWDSVDGPEGIPDRIRAVFETAIGEYKTMAKEKSAEVEVSKSTVNRLEELGYL